MKQIFLAPRSNETAYQNYVSSMQGKTLEEFIQYLSSAETNTLKGDERYFVWGCQPGKRSVWEKMQYGDYVLFYAHGRFISVGTLKFKKYSEALALSLWPVSKETGEPWSCVFFVENVQEIDISLEEFNKYTNYHLNAVMGFMRVSKEEAISSLHKKFGTVDSFVHSLVIGIDEERVQEIIELAGRPSIEFTKEDKAKLDALTRGRSPEEIEFAIQLYAQRQLGQRLEQVTKVTKAYKRNIGMVNALKEKYQHKCQICGFTFKTATGAYYSEAAHIIPISKGSVGVDHPDNIWILCANHHKMLDRQALKATGHDRYEIDGSSHELMYK
ncbi:MAG TPA: HNH endonuclease [Verrucomicrobiae bacterium]|nr:HNH endonuclease [Verrucomicrobiae bacterium]